MKEDDYISISDMAIVNSALIILKQIAPENSEIIDTKDFNSIIAKLTSWNTRFLKSNGKKING